MKATDVMHFFKAMFLFVAQLCCIVLLHNMLPVVHIRQTNRMDGRCNRVS